MNIDYIKPKEWCAVNQKDLGCTGNRPRIIQQYTYIPTRLEDSSDLKLLKDRVGFLEMENQKFKHVV